ncbi:probable ATP-dependent RNA helicase DDX10 isoform X2 [Neocloeon triangulifer]|uniref:probable ATP-dependent RNA helicase DDX10 isoform X2 n=1 Tax=Neocloeon triangulifer TaxID=2078957 RepID=UPI00286F78AB|nr:probable ATP-dependent RNA helicase DDX10 isoform X2 [Neocloeon triangulifer]
MASDTHVSDQNKQKYRYKNGKKFGKVKEKRWEPKKRPYVAELDSIKSLQESYKQIDLSKVSKFSDLPLSWKTVKGLSENEYTSPTEIQRASLLYSMQGNDILGAAKTGSGKTLAFLIPVIERLYCLRWTRLDGLGALIITPTRELAFQIFETLRKVGHHHDFSAGLIIGGKDLKFETKRMDQCNIVIGTPGRILQHMDENPLFDCVTMKMLVLDEADRCLDMGFEKTMNSIIENLPPERQTLLFSATQTKSVKDLARLSLKNPMYVSVHENAKHVTPEGLKQSYMVCELHEKLAMLWSFVKHHKRSKILVFLSSCKQVKYIYEALCRLRPGISLMALYGSLHQMRRMTVYEDFCKKKHAVLFATDIAARGLDFPAVDWVLQLDCPEDVDTYVHRAGRTARFTSIGEALLVLLPSEEQAMIENLTKRRVPIEKIQVNPRKLNNPQRALEACLARDSLLKESAQRAFISYFKAVYLMKDKDVFDVKALDSEAYARSLGLALPPRIRFLERKIKAENKKNVDAQKDEAQYAEEELSHQNQAKIPAQDAYDFKSNLSDSDDDVLTIKRKNHALEGADDDADDLIDLNEDKLGKRKVTKAAVAKKILKKKIVANKKMTFDEEGEAVRDGTKEKVSEAGQQYEKNTEGGGINIEEAKQTMQEEDKFDKQRFRERLKAKKREAKQKLKQKKAEEREAALFDEGEDSDEEGPDLSWLPDPDKIYGKDRESGDEESQEEESKFDDDSENESEQMDLDEDEEPPSKKKKPSKKSVLSLEEEEELALQFLRSRK